MTEFSEIIEDSLFVITGKYLRTLVRHYGNLDRAYRILNFAVNVKIFRKDLLDPCKLQLGVLKDRVEQGRIPEASSAELEAIEFAWSNTIVGKIMRGWK